MPQTRECDYCGQDIEPGTGTMFVRTDGSTTYYCSSKCEKNADLGREPRETEWTAAGREQADRRASQAAQEPAATEGREEQDADESTDDAESESEEAEEADDAEAVEETAEADEETEE
jgi:large subunit ribosomal protein L24e